MKKKNQAKQRKDTIIPSFFKVNSGYFYERACCIIFRDLTIFKRRGSGKGGDRMDEMKTGKNKKNTPNDKSFFS